MIYSKLNWNILIFWPSLPQNIHYTIMTWNLILNNTLESCSWTFGKLNTFLFLYSRWKHGFFCEVFKCQDWLVLFLQAWIFCSLLFSVMTSICILVLSAIFTRPHIYLKIRVLLRMLSVWIWLDANSIIKMFIGISSLASSSYSPSLFFQYHVTLFQIAKLKYSKDIITLLCPVAGLYQLLSYLCNT